MRQQSERRTGRKAYVKRMKKIRIIFWCLVLCLFLGCTSTLIAKYYGKESRKGVATASGLYFSSNYLEAVSGEDFPERLNTDHWEGLGACVMNIEVYNYSNILLYNDENLNITYDMYFQMQEEPAEGETYEAIYTVTDDNGNESEKVIRLQSTDPQKISGLYLPGGQANSNKVKLKITPNTSGTQVDGTYRSKKVAVWVVPTAPDYVASSTKLGAILSASPSKQSFSYHGAFDISEKLEGKTWEECKGVISSYAGFVYRIQTSGELDDSYEGKKMKITWDSTCLEMDQYNKYYQEALSNHTIVVDNGHTSFTMDLVSYISMEFNFYKTADFDFSKWNSKEEFQNLVTVELVD